MLRTLDYAYVYSLSCERLFKYLYIINFVIYQLHADGDAAFPDFTISCRNRHLVPFYLNGRLKRYILA